MENELAMVRKRLQKLAFFNFYRTIQGVKNMNKMIIVMILASFNLNAMDKEGLAQLCNKARDASITGDKAAHLALYPESIREKFGNHKVFKKRFASRHKKRKNFPVNDQNYKITYYKETKPERKYAFETDKIHHLVLSFEKQNDRMGCNFAYDKQTQKYYLVSL